MLLETRQTGKLPVMLLLRIVLCIACCSYACVLAVARAAAADQEPPCSNCATNSIGEDFAANIPDDELRHLMIEHIKKQILQKLRMTAPPHVTKPVIPEVLLREHLLDDGDAEEDPFDAEFSRDDFYGRAEEVVIFPDNTSTHNCYRQDEVHPNSCFLFRLTTNVTTRSVRSADLWMYAVDSNSTSSSNNTYTVSEIIPDPRGDGDSFFEHVIAILDTSSSGWLKFELGLAVRTWSHRHRLTHAIQISCAGCDPALESPVSTEDGWKPFFIVHTNALQKEVSRTRRSLTCREGGTTCCKENFRLYFKDINWHQWIVQPQFYEANFCRGSCMMDVSDSRYHHTTVIRRYIRNRRQDNNSVSLCCVASRMKPLTIFYVDKERRIIKSVLPNMVVESCECV